MTDKVEINEVPLSKLDPKATRKSALLAFKVLIGIFLLISMGHVSIFVEIGQSEISPNTSSGNPSINIIGVALAVILFIIHHTLSFWTDKKLFKQHPSAAPTLISAMVGPFLRILPMFFIGIIGTISIAKNGDVLAVSIFILIKTMTDIILSISKVSHPVSKNYQQNSTS